MFKFKTTQNVDPLFRYIYQYRSNLFKESPILEAEIKEFRRIIKKEVRVVYQLDLDDEINDWLDEVLDTARVELTTLSSPSSVSCGPVCPSLSGYVW